MTVAAKPCVFRTHLGNRFAIPTLPQPRRLLDSFNTKSRKELSSAIPSAFLQALPSIRKACSRPCDFGGKAPPHAVVHDWRLSLFSKRRPCYYSRSLNKTDSGAPPCPTRGCHRAYFFFVAFFSPPAVSA